MTAPGDHPVDVLEHYVHELELERKPEVMRQLRAYCDEPVDAEAGDPT